MDWDAVSTELTQNVFSNRKESDSESMAMQMRQTEIKKNEMLMKLIPSVLPVVTRIADLMKSDKSGKIIDGIVSIFETVLPLLGPVFDILDKVLNFVNKYILNPLRKFLETISTKESVAVDEGIGAATSENANGGIVLGKSIVGERGPEAIIPLDYSRAQRAENISYAIQNSFNMSGNQTTALSLSQAVSSRDFTRAMGMAAFKASRSGAF